MVGLLPHPGARGEGKRLPSPLSQASLPACLPQVTCSSFQVHNIISSNICSLGNFPTPEYSAMRHHNRRYLEAFYLHSPHHTGPLEH